MLFYLLVPALKFANKEAHCIDAIIVALSSENIKGNDDEKMH
jgi:hypothetical protein